MSRSVSDRLACLKAVIARSEEVKHLRVLDGIKSFFTWYGVHRLLVKRRLVLTPLDEQFDWVGVGGYGIAWPRGIPLDRLIGALIELWAPSNPHYYFTKPTEMHEGFRVVDVGASEGAFAVECIKKHRSSRVWCFEPDSSMSLALRITAARNNIAEKLEVIPAAVTDATGDVLILENPADPLASYCIGGLQAPGGEKLSGTAKRVAGISLDDWADRNDIERVDYLKIDAEGSDLAVLEGARACLMRWRPSIAVTTYHRPDHCNAIIGYIASLNLGYQFGVKGVISFNSIPRPVMLHAAAPTGAR